MLLEVQCFLRKGFAGGGITLLGVEEMGVEQEEISTCNERCAKDVERC
jgi:hypothetical protein